MDPCCMFALYLWKRPEGTADVWRAWKLMGVDVGSGNPNNVLSRHAGFTIEDEDAIGV